jgi:hypothetical protein
VQRAENDCNTGHAQRREAGAEADCETRKYRRGNFCPSFTTKQGNCFHEYEGRYDRSYEGCKEAEYDRETEAENPRVQQSDYPAKYLIEIVPQKTKSGAKNQNGHRE